MRSFSIAQKQVSRTQYLELSTHYPVLVIHFVSPNSFAKALKAGREFWMVLSETL